jgi:DNA polymerase sigma
VLLLLRSGVNGILRCDPRAMSNELTELVEQLTPSPRELATQQKAFAAVTAILKEEWAHCQVHLFGESGRPNVNMDMVGL